MAADANSIAPSQEEPKRASTEALSAEVRASQEKRGFDHHEKQSESSLDQQQQQQPREFDPAEVKKITRKIDYKLVPMLMLMYTLTFLDRVNIGNARLWSMESDLGMEGYDYNIAVLVFYIPYIILEIPSNMILSRVQPRYYLSALMFCWGVVIIGAGFAKSFAGLVVCRVLIGVFEAGMFPGCMYLIGSWYSRHQVLTRMAWFMVANDVSFPRCGRETTY